MYYVFHLKLDERLNVLLLILLQKMLELTYFFSHTGGMKDYMTDVKFIHRPLLVLTKVNNEQRSRTSSS